MSKNTTGAGRKPKYTKEVLLQHVSKYIAKYPNKNLTFASLSKETGIPSYVWRDNKDVRAFIEKANKSPILANTENFNLIIPSAESLVEANYNNKKALIRAIQDCLDVVTDLYTKVVDSTTGDKIKQQETRIQELEAMLQLKDKEIESLNKEIDNLYLDSENPLKRSEKGIKNNLIEINKFNEKSLSKDLADIEDEYEGLFD
ncbi:hypothetical protein ACV3V0_15925 [Clostridium perfringens]